VRRTALALGLFLLACSTRAPRGPRPTRTDADRGIRVALIAPEPRVGASSDFVWLQSDGRTVAARGRRNEQWRIERSAQGTQVRAIRDGGATHWQSTLRLRANGNGFAMVNGKRYRGEIVVFVSRDSELLVLNRLDLEDYLQGVVPLEMGNRPRGDSAALQAQAVASRSYAYVRLNDRKEFDVRSSIIDQAYGGVDVENDLATAAVDATRGLMLRYQGRVADALYSSTCGGSTAEAPEVWRTAGSAYLRRVSDRVGTTDRYYCEASPRFRWTRTLQASQLNAALDQYLKAYASVPAPGPGNARHVAVVTRTPSGRVGVLEVETDRGSFPLRGNDIRYVMRVPGGEILSSTYFSVEPEYGRDGLIERVTIRGRGNGHGVGMCQWGAIGRARAGHSFRSILGTYYPGTTVGPIQ